MTRTLSPERVSHRPSVGPQTRILFKIKNPREAGF